MTPATRFGERSSLTIKLDGPVPYWLIGTHRLCHAGVAADIWGYAESSTRSTPMGKIVAEGDGRQRSCRASGIC